MEILGLIDVPWWILWPLAIVLSFIGYCLYYQTSLKRRGIPGPTPKWIMGNMKDLIEEGVYGSDRRYAETYGRYCSFYFGNHPVIMVFDPEIIHEITIAQFSKFYNRGDTVIPTERWQNSINNAKGSKWKYLRSVIQPAFSSAKIKVMSPIIRKSFDELLSILNNNVGEEIDISERYSALTMDVICTTAFGIEVNSQKNKEDPFVKHASKVLGVGLTNYVLMLNFIFPTPFIRKIIMRITGDWTDRKAMDFLTQTVKQAIEMRMKDSSVDYHDLLKLMMDTQMNTNGEHGISVNKTFEQMKQDGMSDEDIVINGIIMLAAGYDTTSSLLTWITYYLALYPDHQVRLYEEIQQIVGTNHRDVTFDDIMKMEFLEMFMQETLRLKSPAGRFNRQPKVDVEIKGLKFKKGDDITIGTHGIHSNPLYWPDPDKFDPERFAPENKHKIIPYSYLPFGAGPRNCVGMKLALAEAKMVIVHLLQRMRVLKSSKFTDPPKMRSGGGLLRIDGGLWVKLESRQTIP
ncbi:Cytochrome P450 3A4 [Mactra antiquata]